jgi:hypothetical protein
MDVKLTTQAISRQAATWHDSCGGRIVATQDARIRHENGTTLECLYAHQKAVGPLKTALVSAPRWCGAGAGAGAASLRVRRDYRPCSLGSDCVPRTAYHLPRAAEKARYGCNMARQMTRLHRRLVGMMAVKRMGPSNVLGAA